MKLINYAPYDVISLTPSGEVECVAPLDDTIDVKVKGYHHSLRKDEA